MKNETDLPEEKKQYDIIEAWRKIAAGNQAPFPDPEFDKATKVHDWRNHVPHYIKTVWPTLTDREKQLIIYAADIEASAEEWD